ncbi:hypothetical protein PT974_01421 [Cladobotryum mycophilum]|uniref:Uncharacterized protein n=1 Tax=Cladobotryum mycophilum TaxID=491253 RepID=A0ABR0T494_9HYPO
MATPKPKPDQGVVTKQRAVICVSIVATTFILCPERLRIWRDLCVVPVLAWLTALAFDVKDGIDDAVNRAWNSVPSWIKKSTKPVMAGASTMNIDEKEDWVVSHALNATTARLSRLLATSWNRVITALQISRRGVAEYLKRVASIIDPESKNIQTIAQTNAHEPNLGDPLQPSNEIFHRRRYLFHVIISLAEPRHLLHPPMSSSLTFFTHLSFCLVERSIWESRRMTVLEKLTAGHYWDIRGKCEAYNGIAWTEREVLAIRGVEVLGVVDEDGVNPIDRCDQYFDSLRHDWDYINMSWNDVDFAIILGLLTTGPRAAKKSKALLDIFNQLRTKQVFSARAQEASKGSLNCWWVGAASGIITVATLGAASPLTVPLFVGSWATGIGYNIAGVTIDQRNRSMLEKRTEACLRLCGRFPQLRGIFDEGL